MTPPPAPAEAAREAERLRRTADVNAQTALLQAMRASARESEAQVRAQELQVIRRSTSWRLTFPLRLLVSILVRGPGAAVRRAVRLRRLVLRHGMAGAASRVARRIRGRVDQAVAARTRRRVRAPEGPGAAMVRPAAAVVAPRVLVVAELSLPQCAKYRVWQRQASFTAVGTECMVVDWRDLDACRTGLQCHALVIFYRVPAHAGVLSLIGEARRLGVKSYWEADDLIFDIGHYRANRNLETLDPALRQEVLSGVAQFRAAMLACDGAIASTPALAEFMRQAGVGPVHVIENALDQETIETAAKARAAVEPAAKARAKAGVRARASGDVVWIAYGSGSKAHDIDFAEAAPALVRLMQLRPQVRLSLMGDLQLPAALGVLAARIERRPATHYRAYLERLGEADISIAPLEATAFNEAKSNIKFLEASIVGLPSVCSPRASFREVVAHGQNGFLADTEEEWLAALLRLVDDAPLRDSVGQAALRFVSERYAPDRVARQQVLPLVQGLDQRATPALRVLVANIYFAPTSFGGATIVAEEMASGLAAMAGTEVFVFTSNPQVAAQYSLHRVAWRGLPVFGVALPRQDVIAEFDNPEMAAVFDQVLKAVQPDVVHFHAVQGFGASLLRSCERRGRPYVVTVHDAWWLCARQFMVKADNSYCFQTTIDLAVCEACLPGSRHLRERLNILLHALEGATAVLSPSEAHRQLYLANGLDPDRLRVNRNGVRHPQRPRRRVTTDHLRFGFVGGTSGLKGFHLIRRAFERTAYRNYTLIVVDNTLNLGFSSIDVTDWTVSGTVETVPAYKQDGLDDFFDGLDVLLFPSQWKESFGLIVGEALARDVWVVATDGGGAAELVVDGENGTLIPLRNDPGPLQRAVEALLADPSRLAGHVNRHKGLLNSYGAQAEELRAVLTQAAFGGQPGVSAAASTGAGRAGPAPAWRTLHGGGVR